MLGIQSFLDIGQGFGEWINLVLGGHNRLASMHVSCSEAWYVSVTSFWTTFGMSDAPDGIASLQVEEIKDQKEGQKEEDKGGRKR